MKKNDILVKITHNAYPRYTGLEQYKIKINEEYSMQVRPKWYPAFSEGFELFIDVFINSDAWDFIKNIVIGGFTWDVMKLGARKLNLKAFIDSTNTLIEENDNSIELSCINLQFDDITIKILGLNEKFTSTIIKIFDALYKVIPELERLGVRNISEIRLPIIKETEDDITNFRYRNTLDNDNVDYLMFWEIISEFGCMHYVYDLTCGKLEEHYGIN